MEIIKKYKIYIICIGIIILAIVSVVVQKIQRENTMKVNSNEILNDQEKIAVYITGEVKNPGVYYIDKNSRLSNLLDICGGVNETADLDKLNLAQKLIDSDKIVVSKKVEEKISNEKSDDFNNESIENEKININTASQKELEEIPGVGESTAKKIIEYRNSTSFDTIEDIMEVPGIGESKFNNMKDSICI